MTLHQLPVSPSEPDRLDRIEARLDEMTEILGAILNEVVAFRARYFEVSK